MCKADGHDPDRLVVGNLIDDDELLVADDWSPDGEFCHFLWREWVPLAIAVAASDAAAGVVSVPAEATDDMAIAGVLAANRMARLIGSSPILRDDAEAIVRASHRAMLSASPYAEGQGGDVMHDSTNG